MAADTPELAARASDAVTRADQAGYERGLAQAAATALTARAAGVVLRAQADACTAMSKLFTTPVPPAAQALTQAAGVLRTAATKLGG
jgi:hypothetical protein